MNPTHPHRPATRKAALLLLAALPLLLTAADSGPAIDRRNMDLTLSPGNDFYRYVSGEWINRFSLPADRSNYDSFDQVREQNQQRLRDLFTSLAASAASAPRGSAAQKVGDFYASAMDEKRIEALGVTPLAGEFDRISGLSDMEAFQDLLAGYHRQGSFFLFGGGVEADFMNAKAYSFYLAQGGLGLPDRDDYTRTGAEADKLRADYRQHIAAMLSLAGDEAASAAARADTVIRLETRLAQSSKTNTEMRDIPALYNKMSLADLQKTTPGFDWARYVKNLGGPAVSEFIVMSPKFYEELGRMLQDTPLADWKIYLRWHLLNAAAPYLSAPFVNENFRFFGKVMQGIEQIEERWKRMTDLTSFSLGEQVGRMYVDKYFPVLAKRRMDEMAANLKKAFSVRLARLPWMSEATRRQALQKLEAMRIEVGYPSKWEDDSSLQIGRDSLLENLAAVGRFAVAKNLAQLGKPVDTLKWDMSPQTVNAGYNPLFNKMVFPAGILQPPFFFADADDAVNYGAIGMAIGHEMSHGFDDQGRYFDKDGNLRDWWTPEDAAQFKQQTERLVQQYEAFTSSDGEHVNGRLSLGENIADYAGLTIAYDAYQLSRQGRPAAAPIDGFSDGQRFFLAFAQLWRGKIRPEALKRKIREDVHPWGEFRVNGAPFNVAAFYTVFDIKPGDKLYRSPEQRPAIW